MKKSYINKISVKKQRQIEEKLPIRILLCQIAGGTWVQTSRWGGHCDGGMCALCGKAGGYTEFGRLHPHEKIFRSQGGKLSLTNSIMAHNWCQAREHHQRVVAPDEEAKNEKLET